jgi:hypothetical protein
VARIEPAVLMAPVRDPKRVPDRHSRCSLPERVEWGCAVSRLAWTDPAPLEVERLRLPWWTLSPKLLLAASPIIAAVMVVTAVPFTEHGLGAGLAPNASTSVPLAVLRERATVGEVTL